MKLRIRQPELNPHSCRVWLDDKEISRGLSGVSVTFDAGDVTVAELRIFIDDLDVDAETIAQLQARVAAKEAA